MGGSSRLSYCLDFEVVLSFVPFCCIWFACLGFGSVHVSFLFLPAPSFLPLPNQQLSILLHLAAESELVLLRTAKGGGEALPPPGDPWMDAEQNSTVSLPLRHRRLEKIGSDHSPTCKEITTTTTTVLMGQVSPRLEKDDDDSAEVTHACFFFSEKE